VRRVRLRGLKQGLETTVFSAVIQMNCLQEPRAGLLGHVGCGGWAGILADLQVRAGLGQHQIKKIKKVCDLF
jgi:hypothetical protein